jgi:hypothetical protein
MPLSRACPARRQRSLTPLEFGFKIVVLEFLLRDDVAEFGAGDVNDSTGGFIPALSESPTSFRVQF